MPQKAIDEFVLAYEVHLENTLSSAGRPRICSAFTHIIFFFIFFRHYPVDGLMAAIFGISITTANRMRHRITSFMYDYLSPKLSFTEKNQRLAQARTLLNVRFTWVVDGAEQPCKGSTHAAINGLLFSTKKKQHSITILIFVTMQGRIISLSKSYPGSVNDLDMAEREAANWNHFDNDEIGMGDAGFRGIANLKSQISNHLKSQFRTC